jgi:hypothetical protein
MAAGLKRDVNGRAAHIHTARCRITQRIDFGMCFAGSLSMTRREDLAVADNHTTDTRIRAGQEQAFGGLVERSAHGGDVIEGWVN